MSVHEIMTTIKYLESHISSSPFIAIWTVSFITAMGVVIGNYPEEVTDLFASFGPSSRGMLWSAADGGGRILQFASTAVWGVWIFFASRSTIFLFLLLTPLLVMVLNVLMGRALDRLSRSGGLLNVVAGYSSTFQTLVDRNITLDLAMERVGERAIQVGLVEGEG